MIDTATLEKPFLGDQFLLDSPAAQELYHDYAAGLPIIDYHCHLPPDEIAGNRQFENITRIWLDGDHYKWRAMRANGVDERYITGKASDAEKFQKWAETVPYTMRNPLYHWTHLELRRYFGVYDLLNGDTAGDIYQKCSDLLQQPDFAVRSLLEKMNVEIVCTTDDPTDDLAHHQAVCKADIPLKMLPAFRPDKAILIGNPGFGDYMEKLARAAGSEIRSFPDLLDALTSRMDFFHREGCRLSDHGLEQVYAADFKEEDADRILKKKLAGQDIFPGEALIYQSAVLYYLGIFYHERGWAQQFHLGALRNNNQRLTRALGPDTGFDSIGDFPQAQSLARFLDRLDSKDKLAKTVIYNLNPADNEVIASMIGNFNDGRIAGKMQFGSAWWFLDQLDGMEKQMNALSNSGLLSRFIGMLTDSRSFLSFPRHEYFRRLVCKLFGDDIEKGLLPNDIPWIGKLVQDICYYNAKNYFNFQAPAE